MRRPARRASGPRPRVAIAHDYLTQRGGAERVVLAMARAFPEAAIHTTFYDPGATYPEFLDLDIRASPVNRIGWLRRHHRAALPFMPLITRTVRIDADIVLVSSSGWAHGFNSTGTQVIYCHSPARWLYHRDAYLGDMSTAPVRLALAALTPWLRWWDKRAARRASRYLANSRMIQERIKDAYDIPSSVLPAPQSVDVEGPTGEIPEIEDWVDDSGYYLCVSRLLPYKNVDAVVGAFAQTPDRRLVIVGQGPDREAIIASAPANVRVLSDLSDREMRALYSGCHALVAASYEDYGLTPIEAASYGKPSVVLRWGGYLDTMVEGLTAVMFAEPEPDLIRAAVDQCERQVWDHDAIRDRAEEFSEPRFAKQLHAIVSDAVATHTPPARDR